MQSQYYVETMTGLRTSYFSNSVVQNALVAYTVMIPVWFGMLVVLDRYKSSADPASQAGVAQTVDAELLAEQRRATSPEGDYVIRTQRLGKVYNKNRCCRRSVNQKPIVAVNDLSLVVPCGECLGLLGRNGSVYTPPSCKIQSV
jgi:ABC-type glutathione transport system ATPase component